jgi:hypothetical protein
MSDFLGQVFGQSPRRSLGERQTMASADERFRHELDSFNQWTGLYLTARIDWDGFTEADFESGHSLHGWCQTPFDVLRALATASDGGLGKTAIQEQVREVICGRAAERTASLNSGVLTFTVNFETSGDYDFLMAYLKKAL